MTGVCLLYIRDDFGCWDVGAHFFVSGEDGDSVGMALKIVRQLERRWIPRYIPADQSSVEANSIQLAFPGLSAGEQECDVILCTVHVMRTWMKKIYHLKTRERMILAMHKRTKAGCEQIIQQAINSCPEAREWQSGPRTNVARMLLPIPSSIPPPVQAHLPRTHLWRDKAFDP